MIDTDEENQSSHKYVKSGRVVLQVENLTKKFDEIVAVNDVSFEVFDGEILGIIGANGSGKTTLFNLLSGVHNPTSGKVFAVERKPTFNQRTKRIIMEPVKYFQNAFFTVINGILKAIAGDGQSGRFKIGEKRETRMLDEQFARDITGMRPDIIINEYGIARTFQIVRPFKFLTAQENATVPHVPKKLLANPTKLKSEGIRSLLAVDLGEKKNYPAAILPHGDLKRLDIARALACNPKIILLDEPFSGLSVEDAFRVTQLIKRANEELGVTIMIVEHKLKLLSNLVERIIVLDQGRLIVSGTPKQISTDKRVIEAYLGTESSQIA